MSSSMLIGFNNDVEFKGRMFHIQTEDHGIKDGHITTILFFSGQILDSKKISYVEDIEGVSDDEERKKAIKKRMVDLHREFYKRLFDGLYEEKVKQFDPRDGSEPSATATSPSGTTPSVRPTSGAMPSVSSSAPPPMTASSPALKPVLRATSSTATKSLTGLGTDRKGPPPLRTGVGVGGGSGSGGASSRRPSSPGTPGVQRRSNGDGGHPAFRGLLWPTEDLRIDGLVAEFLDSQSG